MTYHTTIDNVTALKWGLSIQEAYVFAFIYNVPSWADKVIISEEVYFFCSRTKVITEIPLFTDKPDTVYRCYKKLEDKNLILLKKVDGKDCIKLTEKAKHWNRVASEYSEKNPSNPGKKSVNGSEKNPTYNNTSINNNTIDNSAVENSTTTLPLFPGEDKIDKSKIRLMKNSGLTFEMLQARLSDPAFDGVDLRFYFESILDWSNSANKKRTFEGWVSTIRNAIRRDNAKGKLKRITNQEDAGDALEFLSM
jgi:hypothetical protein